jgi:hypothetical protein
MFVPILGGGKGSGLLWIKSNKMASPSRNISSPPLKPPIISSSRTKRIHLGQMHQKLSQKERAKLFAADQKIEKISRKLMILIFKHSL